MKKKYVRPESRLYVINLAENIASSGDDVSGDLVNGNMVIKFTSAVDGCRQHYTGDSTAIVTVNTNHFVDYENELRSIITNGGNIWTYFNCLSTF